MFRSILAMPLSTNRVVIACAGSGKTTRLVKEALASADRRIAFLTYTNNNARAVVRRFGEMRSGVPKNVDVMTWFTFLLRECARPYQRGVYDSRRIESLFFVNNQSAKFVPSVNVEEHYFAGGGRIYSDKIAKFVIECERISSQAVSRRVSDIYTDVFIDEFQDLAGWDLEVVKMLFASGVRVTLVGDPRQHIYTTNPASKNKGYLGVGIVKAVGEWEKRGLCSSEPMSGSHRCGPAACEFVNSLWPELEPMTSLRGSATIHDGVFLVPEAAVGAYIQAYGPQVLRYDKNAKTHGHEAMNFGAVKGLEFDRVLIFPTGPIKEYLETGALNHVERGREKLHVAVTRARHSVAFVFNGHSPIVPNRWSP